MKKLLIVAFLALFSSITLVQAEITREKRQEIDKMLRLTGMEKLMVQMKSQMITGLKAQMADAPEEFWTSFQEKMDMSELLEKIVPLYDKYYTLEDLKAVNAFYESPAGKKILSTLPQIMQESMEIGQEWGAEVGKKAAREAKALKKKK